MNTTKVQMNMGVPNMAVLINQKIRAKQAQAQAQATKKKQVKLKRPTSWVDTPNFKGNAYNMVANLKHICGEKVFGKGRGREIKARSSVSAFLERASKMDVFLRVEGGTVITSPPTKEECITKLRDLSVRAFEYYSKLPYQQTDVTDNWAADALVRRGAPLDRSVPLQKRILERREKRFTGKPTPAKEQVADSIYGSRGMLCEGHVVAFLNSGFKCPECKTIGQIGWCDGVTHRSVDAFRDAVCMHCHTRGVMTLFEIKTRWEKVVEKCGNGTYAGSFVALNALMTIGANVYLVVASRDTGDVRVGKITSAKMRGNESWLYALQEGVTWGGPSSYVTCAKGFFKCPVKMQPLVETVSDEFVKEVADAALLFN